MRGVSGADPRLRMVMVAARILQDAHGVRVPALYCTNVGASRRGRLVVTSPRDHGAKMTEQQTTENAPAANTGEGQEPANTAAAATPDAPAASEAAAAGTSDDDDRVGKANREAKNLRTRALAAEKEAAELREKVEAAELAKLGEKEQAEARAEKAEKAAADANTRANNALATVAISQAAIDAKLVDPSIANDLLLSQVEFDDAGKPTNAADLVKSLVAARPYLVNRGGSSAGGAPGAAAPGQQPATEDRDSFLKRMKMR